MTRNQIISIATQMAANQVKIGYLGDQAPPVGTQLHIHDLPAPEKKTHREFRLAYILFHGVIDTWGEYKDILCHEHLSYHKYCLY